MDSSDEDDVFMTCEICDLPFTGIKPFEQHLKGKKHQKEMKRKLGRKSLDDGSGSQGTDCKDDEDEFMCDICEVTCSGRVSYNQHLRSKPHAKALRKKKGEEDLTRYDVATSISELPDNDADLHDMVKEIVPESFATCSICEKEFTGPESFHQHMKSKFHHKRISQLQILKKIKGEFGKYKNAEVGDAGELSEELQFGEGLSLTNEHGELECKECQKSFTSAVSFAQHLTSKSHTKRKNQNKLLEELQDIKASELEGNSSTEDPESEDDGTSSVLTCAICNVAFSGPEAARAHLRSRGHQKALKWRKYLEKSKLSKQSDHPQTDLAVKNGELTIDSDYVKAECVEEKSDGGKQPTELDSSADHTNVPEPDDYEEEKCPPYQESEEQVPSKDGDEDMSEDFSFSGTAKNSKSLYPQLPADYDQKTPESSLKEGHQSSESEDSNSEDEFVASSSTDSKKNKTTKCKSGVRKIVKSIVKALE